MDLFSFGQPQNLLPYDGTVVYYGSLFSTEISNQYFSKLLAEIEWRNDEAMIFGKRIITKRKVAWYADEEFDYTYSNTTKKALFWISTLLELKSVIEEKSNEKFNSCLLNLYHNGDEGMAWHSDAEKELKKNGAIASVSFGAERKFSFRHKQSKKSTSVFLENGSLLVMKGTTQTHWMHRLPPSKKIVSPRINLTFRTINKT